LLPVENISPLATIASMRWLGRMPVYSRPRVGVGAPACCDETPPGVASLTAFPIPGYIGKAARNFSSVPLREAIQGAKYAVLELPASALVHDCASACRADILAGIASA